MVRDEIAWLETRLGELEDWRALTQLEAREARGEVINAIDGQRLKSFLLQSLSDNPLFERHKVLLAQIGALPDAAPAKPSSSSKPAPMAVVLADDLSRIRGIGKTMVRRLSGVGVTSFSQIADWTSGDVHHVAKTLGLGRQISSENWIEQAALLARGSQTSPPRSAEVPPAQQSAPSQIETVSTPGEIEIERSMEKAEAADIAVEETAAIADLPSQPDGIAAASSDPGAPPPAPWPGRNYVSAEPNAMTVGKP